MECGDWSPYSTSNDQYTIFERKVGQSKKVDFEYRGYRTNQCLDANYNFTYAEEYSINKSTFDEYGNPIVIFWDPDRKNIHSVSYR